MCLFTLAAYFDFGNAVCVVCVVCVAIPVTAEVGKIEFDLLESDALKLMEGEEN